jgi:hypothetical protein
MRAKRTVVAVPSCVATRNIIKLPKKNKEATATKTRSLGLGPSGTVIRTADGLAGSAAIETAEPGGYATGVIARQRPPTRATRFAIAAAWASTAAGTAADARLTV